MKRILAFAFAATACTSANASPWHQFTPESYFLIPSNSKDILAFANLFNGKMNVALSDASGQYCEKGEDKAPTPAGVFKVNDQYVKFIQGCLNGKRMLVPETQAGRDFFAAAITTTPTSVNIGFGMTLHFDGENFEAARKAMIEAQSAL